jgi:hypothetical protein
MGQRSIGENQQQFGLLITQNFEIGFKKKDFFGCLKEKDLNTSKSKLVSTSCWKITLISS